MTTALVDRAWCVVVPHHARGARVARHRLADVLTDTIPAALLDDVVAVAAELIGNAVCHATPLPGGVVRLAWRLTGSTVRPVVEVRVTDGGAVGIPHRRVADSEDAGGRGLAIVAALAARWGVDRDGLGQCVWAELRGTYAERS